MKWIACAIVCVGLLAGTMGAYAASTQGAGLPGLLDEPVSIRQDSTDPAASRRRGYAPALLYFGTRRHVGGGYGYGK